MTSLNSLSANAFFVKKLCLHSTQLSPNTMDTTDLPQRRITQICDIHFDESPGLPRSKMSTKEPLYDDRTRKRHILLDESPTRNVPINTNSLSFTTKRDLLPPAKRVWRILSRQSPNSYRSFISLDQSGSAIIAQNSSNNLIAIKHYTIDSTIKIDSIRIPSRNDFLVALLNIYIIGNEVYLVYECMNITLSHILSIPKGQLVTHEIAAICREILRQRDFGARN